MPLETLYRAVWESFFLFFDPVNSASPVAIKDVAAIDFDQVELLVEGMDKNVVEWIRREAWVSRVDKIATQGEMVAKSRQQGVHPQLCSQLGHVCPRSSCTEHMAIKPVESHRSSNQESPAEEPAPSFQTVLRRGRDSLPVFSDAGPDAPVAPSCSCGLSYPCKENRLSFIQASRQYWLANLSQAFFIWPPPSTTIYERNLGFDSPRKQLGKFKYGGGTLHRQRTVLNVATMAGTMSSSTTNSNNLVAEIDFLWHCFQTAVWWNNEAEQRLCRRGLDGFLARRRRMRHELFDTPE